ncbi:hypothetical protein DFS33DRAFT_1269132 [Desarmillaria ectypa]|nr:hypothetical protein DFS33DRAFT_1269132 [Desarmillaria ectypa]
MQRQTEISTKKQYEANNQQERIQDVVAAYKGALSRPTSPSNRYRTPQSAHTTIDMESSGHVQLRKASICSISSLEESVPAKAYTLTIRRAPAKIVRLVGGKSGGNQPKVKSTTYIQPLGIKHSHKNRQTVQQLENSAEGTPLKGEKKEEGAHTAVLSGQRVSIRIQMALGRESLGVQLYFTRILTQPHCHEDAAGQDAIHYAKAVCPTCNAVETIEHFLVKCSVPARVMIWALAEEFWRKKQDSWLEISFGKVLACSLTTFKMVQTLNSRVLQDCMVTNTLRYGRKRALRKELVLRTRSGVLKDNNMLPNDWVEISGVLVVTESVRKRTLDTYDEPARVPH